MNTSSAKIQVAIILGILGLVGLTLVAHAQDSKKADPIFPVIDMNNASLDAAIDTLARQAKFNYICDPKITGSSATADGNSTLPNVTFRWKNLTAKEALAWLLELHGMAMIENPITSVTRITYTNAPVRRVDISLFGTNTNVVPVVMMMSAPLDRAITQLATQGNLKVVIDPKLSDSSHMAAVLSSHRRYLFAGKK